MPYRGAVFFHGWRAVAKLAITNVAAKTIPKHSHSHARHVVPLVALSFACGQAPNKAGPPCASGSFARHLRQSTMNSEEEAFFFSDEEGGGGDDESDFDMSGAGSESEDDFQLDDEVRGPQRAFRARNSTCWSPLFERRTSRRKSQSRRRRPPPRNKLQRQSLRRRRSPLPRRQLPRKPSQQVLGVEMARKTKTTMTHPAPSHPAQPAAG